MVLLQACQGGDRTTLNTVSDPLPTQKSDPHRDQHITLTRPHTVMLLATVRDGLAYRGVFTGKFCINDLMLTLMSLEPRLTCQPATSPTGRAKRDPEALEGL